MKVTATSLLPVSAARQAARESALITFRAWLSFSLLHKNNTSVSNAQSISCLLPINDIACLSVLLVYWFPSFAYSILAKENRPKKHRNISEKTPFRYLAGTFV